MPDPDLEYTHCAPCPRCGRSVAAGTRCDCALSKRCSRCGGDGYLRADGEWGQCPVCHGTGIETRKER